jgi:hypothetical protein
LYRTARWQALRKAQLRSHPLCERCLNESRIVPATVAHHRIPHKGDERLFFEGELVSSCKPHHDSIEQSIERRGYDKTIGVDGWPVDPSHPWARE